MVTVTVLGFARVDDLDLFGAISVLSKAGAALDGTSFFQVSSREQRVTLASGTMVDFGNNWVNLENSRPTDAVLIPGGPGAAEASKDPLVAGFLRRAHGQRSRIYAICTGTLLLAGTGLLTDRHVAMHHGKCDLLADAGCAAILRGLVRDGPLTTVGGDHAASCKSVDMALQLISDFAPGAMTQIEDRMELSTGRRLREFEAAL